MVRAVIPPWRESKKLLAFLQEIHPIKLHKRKMLPSVKCWRQN